MTSFDDEDEARIIARRERDAYIGLLIAYAVEEAKRAHRELGLPLDVKLVFDESGVFTEHPDGHRERLR